MARAPPRAKPRRRRDQLWATTRSSRKRLGLIELQGLIDFDVQRTGFSLAEIHLVLDEAREGSATWDCNPELEGANRISRIDTV